MKYLCLLPVLTVTLALVLRNVSALDSESILNGQIARKDQFPYVIWIGVSYGKHKQFLCGGSLISPDTVLTAAHCVYDTNKHTFMDRPYAVVAGTIDTLDAGHSVAVSKIYLDKKIVTGHNDIAVLKLKKRFDNRNLPIREIEIPEKYEDLINKLAIVVGFGDDNYSETYDPVTKKIIHVSKANTKLRYAETKIIIHKDCTNHPELLCTEGHTAYKGDSGSPLVYKNKVVGIVNHAESTHAMQAFRVFTNVSHFTGFIKGAMNNKPTVDTIAKSIDGYEHFEIPMFELDVTTKSSILISKLNEIQNFISTLNSKQAEIDEAIEESEIATDYDVQVRLANVIESKQEEYEEFFEKVQKFIQQTILSYPNEEQW